MAGAPSNGEVGRFLLVLGWFAGFFILAYTVGFIWASAITCFLYIVASRRGSLAPDLLVSAESGGAGVASLSLAANRAAIARAAAVAGLTYLVLFLVQQYLGISTFEGVLLGGQVPLW